MDNRDIYIYIQIYIIWNLSSIIVIAKNNATMVYSSVRMLIGI